MPLLPAEGCPSWTSPFSSVRSGCDQVIAPPRSAPSVEGRFNGARNGRTSGTTFVTARSGAGAIKKPPIEDQRVENWCQSSHHPARDSQQGTAKCALFTTPSIGLVCGFCASPTSSVSRWREAGEFVRVQGEHSARRVGLATLDLVCDDLKLSFLVFARKAPCRRRGVAEVVPQTSCLVSTRALPPRSSLADDREETVTVPVALGRLVCWS